MKQYIIIIFFIYLSFGIKAQVFNNAYNNYAFSYVHPAQPSFSQYNREFLFDFIPENNNFYLIGGTETPLWRDTVFVNTWIIKVNEQRDTLSHKLLEIDSNDLNIGFVPASFMDNSFLFGNAKKKASNTTSTNNGLIIQVDSNFNIIDYMLMDYGDFTNFNDVAISESSIYVLGFSDIDSSPSINYDIFITKLNYLGQPIDTFQIGGNGWDIGSAIKILDNSNLLVSGYTSSYGSGAEDFYLFEIDTFGNIVWDTTYGDMGSDGNFYYNLSIDNQGYIYHCGWTEKMNGDVEAWIIKTDNVGAIVWDKKFNRGNLFDGFVGISLLENGEILLAGSTHNYDIASNNATGWLVKLDSTGSLIWERLISKYDNQFSTDDYIYKLKCDSNENIFIAGYILGGITENGIYHDNDGWFCKADKCGYTSGAEPSAALTIDSIVANTVYLSNLIETYCYATLIISNEDGSIIDSLEIYAYSESVSGTNPTFLSYTFTDTGSYFFTLYSYAGDGIDSVEVVVSISDSVIGIQENNLKSKYVTIFPNPSNGILTIQNRYFSMLNENFVMEIYNTTGQLINTHKLNPSVIEQKLMIDNIDDGVYFLMFHLDDRYIGSRKLYFLK